MFTIERTTKVLEGKINEAISNGKNKIELTIKSTGDKVIITLCSYAEIKSIADIEYYLVDCRFPWAGSSKLEDVSKLLNGWEDKIKEETDEKAKIKEYYEKYNGTDEFDYDWFSDWHKDVFGFRPHGMPAWER